MKKNIILLLSILTTTERKRLLFFALLTIFLVFIESISIGLIVPIISFFVEENNKFNSIIGNYLNLNNESNQLITILIIFFIAIYSFKTLFVIFYNWYLIRFSNFVLVRISKELLNNYLSLTYNNFVKRNSAELLRNIMGEGSKIRNILRSVLVLFSEFFILLGITIIILLVDFKTSLVAFLVVSISSLLYLLTFKKRVKKLGEESVDLARVVLKSLIQKISSYKFIHIISKKNFFVNEFTKDLTAETQNNLKTSMLNILPRIWIESFGIVCLGIFILYLNFNNYDTGKIITSIGLLAFASMRIFPSVSKVTMSLQSLKYVSAALEKISADLNLNKSSQNMFKNLNIVKFEEKVLFKNIQFSFQETQTLIFDNINFSINKGESIFIKGESGSGKSTLGNIISGLIIPTKGQMIVDNKEYNLSEKKVRLNTGFVHQETYLLDDTIEKNIAVGEKPENINSKKLIESIEQAQLKNFVDQLSLGINTIVGEKGSKISVGQAQRIGIARTLYHNPDLIIFDEATSALDEKNTNQIIETIKKLQTNRSIIFISHNTSYQEQFDKVFEIKNCNLIEK